MTVSTATLPTVLADYLSTRRNAMLDLCRTLVNFESPSDDPTATRRVLERLTLEFERLGYRTRLAPGTRSGGYLFARPERHPGCAATQLLIGHADTVWPVGTLEGRQWSEAGSVAAGPGIFDMKAGLVQMIFALDALRHLRLDPPATPLILINTDEEIGSRESGAAISRLSRIAARAFVCEPGLGPAGFLKTARKGIARYTVTVTGRAAHAGLDPDAGASAILELSSVIQRLFAMNDRERNVTVNVGTIEGGLRPNVIAPESRADVDVRVLTDEDADTIDAAIRSLRPATPGTSISVTGGFGRPPMTPTERNRDLFERARRIGADLGMDLNGVVAGGGSDGNTTSRYTATLDGLGIVGDGAHAPGEHIEVASLVPRTALLAALLMEPVVRSGGIPA